MPLPSRRRQRGFTLGEVLTVVAIVAALAAVGAVALGRGGRSRRAEDVARALFWSLQTARSEAVGDGFQRRLLCTAEQCALQIASVSGMRPPPAWNAVSTPVTGSKDGLLWAVLGSTPLGSVDPGPGPLGAQTAITFFPDGSASPVTIFLSDETKGHPYKIYVFAATGMSRMTDRW